MIQFRQVVVEQWASIKYVLDALRVAERFSRPQVLFLRRKKV